ncbi:branched-chain-amino-acid transaminase [Lyticum sinuosum]|uniref:Branched-chain-amino-acid aminotransferase n=1 Tax=Lyticum sinuosum TaxID=1332059 RepID=A0AAE4VK27_9RICK|nr:branched-chain-amino-acid transaminase [Lyticum sinuosum]MDZ5761391.1 Branched-chain-amino-acid aminotransferase [Lyticum sinuosum]
MFTYQNSSRYIWVDGKIISLEQANFHVMNHSLHYGNAVFEGERSYYGNVFAMEDHHKRLLRSAEILGYHIPYTIEELNKAAKDIIYVNDLTDYDDVYLRLIAWKGGISLGISAPSLPIHLSFIAMRWPTYRHQKRNPLRLGWTKWVRPPPNSFPHEAKAAGQYIISSLCREDVFKEGYDDAVMMDYRGYVAECPGANIFMIKNKVLYTPIADCFLNGITRQTVLKIASENIGLECKETVITKEDIESADEIFVTGSAVEVFPVQEISGKMFSCGKISKDIIYSYLKLVGANIIE